MTVDAGRCGAENLGGGGFGAQDLETFTATGEHPFLVARAGPHAAALDTRADPEAVALVEPLDTRERTGQDRAGQDLAGQDLAGHGRWVPASDLAEGDAVRTMSPQGAAGTATVTKIRGRHAVVPVYNLTVQGTSRYLVGACGVVVHNTDPGDVRPNGRGVWGRPDTLQDHFNRHGRDFGSRSPDEYAQQAADFLVDSQRRGLPTKIDGKGVIRVYDPETNTFSAFNPDGTTATFFKPSRGIDYWNDPRRCPGVTPWSPGR